MKFETAVRIIMELEGGYSFDSQDPGGETHYGISKRAYPNLDIKNLTPLEAQAIYRRDYWNQIHCDHLPRELRLAVFDGAVNQGILGTAKRLQRAARVVEDGVIGPRTLDRLYKMNRWLLMVNFMSERALGYAKLQHFPRYGRGWMRRLFDVALHSEF